MGPKRFRIAFSFAGEKRDFIGKVVAILAQRFGESAILYDKYHEAEFSRARRGRYLPKLYHEESELMVVVICRDYPDKEWCGLVWDAIFDLLKRRREGEVMCSRFDYATAEGLYSDAGMLVVRSAPRARRLGTTPSKGLSCSQCGVPCGLLKSKPKSSV